MKKLAIKQISRAEKLRATKDVWASLSREELRLESPTWHYQALQETIARYDAGQEQPIDRPDA